MREILFRGKRVDNDEWIEGYYFRQYGSNEIVTADDEQYHIFPNTVGQYTGLTDKNGTRIFEGDIVRIFDGEYCSAVIKYSNEKGSFTVDDTSLYYWVSDIEVIGNIYDNGHPF